MKLLQQYNLKVEERMFPRARTSCRRLSPARIDVAALALGRAISAAPMACRFTVASLPGGARASWLGWTAASRTSRAGAKVGVTRGGAHGLAVRQAGKSRPELVGQTGQGCTDCVLAFADLNQALAIKQIDAMCSPSHNPSRAINKKFGVEIMKPYTTKMGEPVRLLVMTEKLYNEKKTSPSA